MRDVTTVRAASALALLLMAGVPAARADDIRVDADTSFQMYEVRSPITPVVWTRRRLVQQLGFTWARTAGDPQEPVRLLANVRLRLDQDFGRTCFAERSGCVNALNTREPGVYQPLASRRVIDAPAAWVEARGLPGASSVRAGRQLRTSPIGFLRMDGVTARSEPTPYVAVEAFGGLVVRDTSLAGTDAFVPQGTLRLDLPGSVEPGDVPFVQPPSTTWTAGGWLALGRTDYVRGRVGVRQIGDESGPVTRRVAVGLASQALQPLRLQADAVWDLLSRRWVDGMVGGELPVGDVTLRGRVQRHVPVFDIGSIWAWFDVVPVDRALIGVDWQLTRRLALGAAVRGRRSHFDDRRERDGGFEGYARLQTGPWRASASGFGRGGDLGPLAAVRLRLARAIGSAVRLAARVSVWHFDNRLQQSMYGTSVTEAIDGILALTQQTRLRMELQHSHNRIVGHRFRAIAFLSLEVWR